MNKKKVFVITVILALVAGWWFLSDSDEEKVIRILNDIAEKGAISSEEHPFERLAKAKELAEWCDDTVLLTVHLADEDHVVTRDRKDLIQKIALARSYFQNFSVNHLNTTVAVSGNLAHAQFLATAHGFLKDKREFRESMEVVVHFQKISGNWLITGAENVGIWPPDEE